MTQCLPSSNEKAGKDAGMLLMEMLDNDKRTYRTRKGYTREYCWTGEEENEV